MKKIMCLLALIAFGQMVFAYGIDRYETKDQYRDRQSYQNYQQYEQNNHQAPLGGYGSNSLQENRGDKYGYNNNSSFNNQNNNNSYNNNRYGW